MTCPRCQTELGTASVCGDCGMRFVRQITGVIKTSAVMISTREAEGFYGSLSDVPARLRPLLEQATNGSNSGTILIADKGGRERILARAAAAQEEPEAPCSPVNHSRPEWAVWAGALLLMLAIAIIVLVWGKWPRG